jgi:P-type E1-E2 ATPase
VLWVSLTPISIMVASGRGAQLGVLFRDAQAIENLRDVDTLVLDKTGTITVGRPAFDRVITVAGFSEEQVLSWLRAWIERANIRWRVQWLPAQSREVRGRGSL